MLFEQRCYTLKPGTTAAFWQAQVDRGFELVQPIQQRLVGYFSNVTGPVDQVTHLYRYDSYEDWKRRLHGLYGVPALEPYFRTVRALMTAQQNQFFAVAPIQELNPLWGNDRDWVPDQPVPTLPGVAPDSLVEEHCTTLLPGTIPSYWQAWREMLVQADAADVVDAGSLIVSLVSLVGRQHQAVSYRHLPNMKAREELAARRQASAAWAKLQATVAPMVVSSETKLLTPGPIPQLSPLFNHQ